jgi:ATP-dependent Clp protease ATP-binding subunit ClpA
VGPRNMNEPIGRCGSCKPARARRTAVATATTASTPSHVAGVVSRWTGVPVDKMLEGEREKLLGMEARRVPAPAPG